MRPTTAVLLASVLAAASVLATGLAAPVAAAAAPTIAAGLTSAPAGSAVTSAPASSAVTSAPAPAPGIYAIDQTQHSVVLFRGGTSAPAVVATGLNDPESIVVDRYNNLYILDDGTDSLVRVSVSGTKTVLRQGLAQDPEPSMAVSGSGDVYLLDGRSMVRYAAVSGAATTLGTSALAGILTVDGAGAVSITGQQDPDAQSPVLVDTYPAAGGPATRRSLPEDLSVGAVLRVTETPSSALYIWIAAGGGSGAEYIMRLNAGSTTTDDINTNYADYMDAVDRSGNYYLLQTRHWCTPDGIGSGTCADDFAIDNILTFAPPRVRYVSKPVSGVDLPLGGVAVDDAGNLYAAEVPINWEPAAKNVPPAQLVRIDGASGARTVVASGSYLDPVVASTVPGRTGTATATLSGSRATLSWSAPSSNGGSPITGYRVSRNGTDAKGTGPWSTVVAAAARSFSFGNLAPGSSYVLSVQAVNGLGTGAARSVTVHVPAVAASSPRSFRVVVNAGTHTVTESWEPPASTGGSAITGYRVARDGVDSAGTGKWSTVVPATARSHTFNSLVAGHRYTFSVSAITEAGVGTPAFGRLTA